LTQSVLGSARPHFYRGRSKRTINGPVNLRSDLKAERKLPAWRGLHDNSPMKSPEPILTGHLFPEVRKHLLELLRSLGDDEWLLPTAAKNWDVKDIAAHLLGGDLGNLSRRRDAYTPWPKAIDDWKDLVVFINKLNASWVAAARRLSPRVLCDLLEISGPQMDEYFASLDPYAIGMPVDWSGPDPAPVWLDIAREYTERWHHQQQIRDATGRPGLYEPRLFAPVLDAFVRALPWTFRDVHAVEGTCVQLSLLGNAGGDWVVRKGPAAWELSVGSNGAAGARVAIRAEDAWKIFTRGMRGEEARRRTTIEGEMELGVKVLEMVSVIA
jgi:uncharacterized protein (TIGR03083 family)